MHTGTISMISSCSDTVKIITKQGVGYSEMKLIQENEGGLRGGLGTEIKKNN